jgi:hypothetical protein
MCRKDLLAFLTRSKAAIRGSQAQSRHHLTACGNRQIDSISRELLPAGLPRGDSMPDIQAVLKPMPSIIPADIPLDER